jgi:DNA polymerase-3 subunit gamma/tau
MPLQTTHRPLNFGQIIGNEEVVMAVKHALKNKDHNHCMLFHGSSGTGKTTLARIVAMRLGAYDPDKNNNPGFREINAADFRGIDNIRAIRDESSRMPLGSRTRVFFMDECHMLTPQAQEMFLKVLEEADGLNYYLFATTNPEKLQATFKRRVAEYRLLPVTDDDMTEYLKKICDGSQEIKAPKEVIQNIVDNSMGSIGIALGILDAIKGLSADQMQKAVTAQAAKQSAVIALCRAISKQGCKWKEVTPILLSLKEQGEDPEGIRRMVLGYCSNWLIKKDEPRAYLILESFAEPMYNIGFPGIVRACYMAVNG